MRKVSSSNLDVGTFFFFVLFLVGVVGVVGVVIASIVKRVSNL